MRNKQILIFSISQDFSTNEVIEWLTYFGAKVIRINGDEQRFLFHHIDEKGIFFVDTLTKRLMSFNHLDACWWRRTGLTYKKFNSASLDIEKTFRYPFLQDISKKHYLQEYRSLKEYICNTLYTDIPVNLGSPLFDVNRLTVLKTAKYFGIKVPYYEIVTSIEEVNQFIRRYGNAVSKTIDNGVYSEYENKRYYTYTEELDNQFLKDNKDNVFFPSLIMSKIEKRFEVRAFYLDGKFYSMAIFSQNNKDTQVDFRKGDGSIEIPFKLPQDIETKLKQLYDHFKLNTGSADLIVDKNGEFFFLEINPVGQFAMTSTPCNYNLHKKVAKYLIYGTTRNN